MLSGKRVLCVLSLAVSITTMTGLPGVATPSPRLSGDRAGSSVDALPCQQVPGLNDQCPTWVSTYDNPNGHNGWADSAIAMALSPDGTTAFVTGESWDHDTGSNMGCCPPPGGMDMATVALDPANGNVRWTARYNGPDDMWEQPSAIAVSPDGSKVFVTGVQNEQILDFELVGDYATIAYDSATGKQLWAASYRAPSQSEDDVQLSWPKAMAVGPDGSVVYVTGASRATSPGSDSDAATVAYDASTGAQLWASRYADTSGGWDGGLAVAVSPHGDRVYVGGQTYAGNPASLDNHYAYLAIAYDAATPGHLGEQVWATVDDWGNANTNEGRFLAISPDGARVYVAGQANSRFEPYAQGVCCQQSSSYGIAAYDTASGQRVWGTTYAGENTGLNQPTGFAIDSSGARLYVTGAGRKAASLAGDYGTVAIDAVDGSRLWASSYATAGASFNLPFAVTAGPDGTRVYVTGYGSTELAQGVVEIATVAYDGSTGSEIWSARFNQDPPSDRDLASCLAVTPDGRGVLVAGVFLHGNGVGVGGIGAGTTDNPGDFGILRYDA